MTYEFTQRIMRIALMGVLLITAFFMFASAASAAEADAYDPVTAVFGPTIDNVPWEYIPAWYKSELLASGYKAPTDASMPPVAPGASPATDVYGPTIANVPWEYVPAWYKAELAASAQKGVTIPTVASKDFPSLTEVTDTEMIGKETAATFGSDVDLAAIDANEWSERVAAAQAAEARSSFMSETSFFFLIVFLVFLALILTSLYKQRSLARREQDLLQ